MTLLKNPSPLCDIRPLEPYDDGNMYIELFGGMNNPVCNCGAVHDASKNVDENTFYSRIR